MLVKQKEKKMKLSKEEIKHLRWLLNRLAVCEGGVKGLHHDLVFKKVNSEYLKHYKI